MEIYRGDVKAVLTINGGNIKAQSFYGAGIGTAFFEGPPYGFKITLTININGGTVTAASTEYGAGIGSGATVGTINVFVNISGGNITATGVSGAGIGTARNSHDGTLKVSVNISGGNITATSNSGAGIGTGGSGSSNADITIAGGTVHATSNSGDGIGTGVNKSNTSASLTMDGGSVTASSIGPTPQNGAGETVYRAEVTLEKAEEKTKVTSLTIDGVTHNNQDIYTDAGGRIYLWLPEGAEITGASAGYQVYSGLITVDTTSTSSGTLKDVTGPFVLSVSPEGSGIGVNGEILITFDEALDTSYPGSVSLENGTGALDLTGGEWRSNREYRIPYSGLDYDTPYTVTVSGFKDMAGNTMDTDSSHGFTTMVQPLNPTVIPVSLTIQKGSTGSLYVDFGQGECAATGAAIDVDDVAIAEVDRTVVTTSCAITVTGLKAGTTDITITFDDAAGTAITVPVTVEPVPPIWPSGSRLTASGITPWSVLLSWTEAQDITAVTGYRLYMDGNPITELPGDVTSYRISGLLPSRSYTFQVQAGNADDQWTADGPAVSITTETAPSGDESDNRSTEPASPAASVDVRREEDPFSPVTAVLTIVPSRDLEGNSRVSVSAGQVSAAIAEAREQAEAQGGTENGITVAIEVQDDSGKALSIGFSRGAFQSLVDAGVKELQISSASLSLSMDLEVLKAILSQSSGDVDISIIPVRNLLGEAGAIIGTRPAYDIIISYAGNGGNAQVTSLGEESMTISIPYAPETGEAVGGLFGIYIDANGNVHPIESSWYDPAGKCLIIPTNHLSIYGVGYAVPSAKYTDIANHWAKEAIDYVVGRGLLSGTSETTFSPDAPVTRAELVMALGKLAGVDEKGYNPAAFTDVDPESAYAPYVEWAYRAGVVKGTGNNRFEPDRNITREEAAIMLVNYAKATGYILPAINTATPYADQDRIGRLYLEAVMAVRQAGIMNGGPDNRFEPGGHLTRAQVASILYRYITLTLDPETAHGWALNDAGQYRYYRDGQSLTGIQTINGIKYFFDENGILKTGWVKDGDNWRYYAGNRMHTGWLNLMEYGNGSRTCYFAADGIMVSGTWYQIDGKWYYFYADGSLARSTVVDGYEVDGTGALKTE